MCNPSPADRNRRLEFCLLAQRFSVSERWTVALGGSATHREILWPSLDKPDPAISIPNRFSGLVPSVSGSQPFAGLQIDGDAFAVPNVGIRKLVALRLK